MSLTVPVKLRHADRVANGLKEGGAIDSSSQLEAITVVNYYRVAV